MSVLLRSSARAARGKRNSPRFVLAAFALLAACAASTRVGAAAPEWAPNVTLTGIWHDNATNATTSTDQLDSLQLNADLLSSNDYVLGTADTLRLTAHLAGDFWPRYRKLLTGAAGGRAEWRHTFGVATLAPTFSLEAGGDYVYSGERARNGTTTFVSAAVRKRLNDRWRASLSHELGQHAARGELYDRDSSETSLELGYDATPKSRITFTLRHRDGDIVSYSDPTSLALLPATRATAITDTFDRPLRAASYDVRTWAGRVAYLHALDDSTAIVVAFETRKNRGPIRFSNNALSVGLVHQF